MTLITLPEWYQIDFKIDGSARVTLEKISKLIADLKKLSLINGWFYLFENTTIRLRFNSQKPEELRAAISASSSNLGLTGVSDKPFEPYVEGDDMFATVEVVEAFANIMSDLTSLTITRLSDAKFSNFRLMERLTHCIFNNIYGSNTEIYTRLKMMGVDFQSNDNPEQTVLDGNQQYIFGSTVTITTPPFTVPTK